MKIFRNKFNSKYTNGSTLVIGNFDGLHKGHISILEESKKLAKKNKLRCGLLTFDPNPKEFFLKDKNFKIISNLEKEKILKKMNIDYLIILKFNKKLREQSADQFINKTLKEKIKPSKIIVGKEFRFGKNRLGTPQLLQNFFETKIAHQKKKSNKKISSTQIRKFIQSGKIKEANNLLGRNWSVNGNVVSGNKIGRELGFRTANIFIKNSIQPLKGVYATRLHLNTKSYPGISNYGVAPTISKKQNAVLETHLFNPIKDLYKKNIKVEFFGFLRKEKKFKTKKNLTDQIKKDITLAKRILKYV